MKIAFVYDEIPNKEHSTDCACAFHLLKFFSTSGHDVHVILFLTERSLISDQQTRERWFEEFKSLKIKTSILWHDINGSKGNGISTLWRKLKFVFLPRLVDYFPHISLAPRLKVLLKNFPPDVIFIWGNWPALAAVNGAGSAPVFAFMGDPPYFPYLHRMRPPFVSKFDWLLPKHWYRKWYARRIAHFTLQLLQLPKILAMTSAYHADWMRRHGLPQCEYLHTIVPDLSLSGREVVFDEAQNKKTHFRILLLGHLNTTANTAGLYFFSREILPHLIRLLGDRFEVCICGKGELPKDIAHKFNLPCIRLLGFVPDLVTELRMSDVVLVPTPIRLGIRIRIPYVWSLSGCVVVHEANAYGMPELRHGYNALLSGTGEGLAKEVARLEGNRDLIKTIGMMGRKTFESCFSYDVTTSEISKRLEWLAKNNSKHTCVVQNEESY